MDSDSEQAGNKTEAESSGQPHLTRLYRRNGQGPVLRGVDELFTPHTSPAPEERVVSANGPAKDPSSVQSPYQSPPPSSPSTMQEPIVTCGEDVPRPSASSASHPAPLLQTTNQSAPTTLLHMPQLPQQMSPAALAPAAPAISRLGLATPVTLHPTSPVASHPASPATSLITMSPLATPMTLQSTGLATPLSPRPTQVAPPEAPRPPTPAMAENLHVEDSVAPRLSAPQDHPSPVKDPRSEPVIDPRLTDGALTRTPPIPRAMIDVHEMDIIKGEEHAVWAKGVPSDSSKHVQDIAAACARGRRWGFAFADALDNFIAFERALGFPDKHGGRAVFVTGLRPPVYTDWLQARRPYDRTMPIGEPTQFAFAWWKWWSVMQPSARTTASGELLALEALYVKPIPLEQMNGMHLCCGKDGLIQFLVTLLWWGDAVNVGTAQQVRSSEQWVEWETAVSDFRDVLVLLVQTPGFDAHARVFAR